MVYLVYVYYNSRSDASGAGGSELYTTASNDADACAAAMKASRFGIGEKFPHEFAVEGGDYETGGWHNPVFRAGVRLR